MLFTVRIKWKGEQMRGQKFLSSATPVPKPIPQSEKRIEKVERPGNWPAPPQPNPSAPKDKPKKK
jgi:hypothetical protein